MFTRTCIVLAGIQSHEMFLRPFYSANLNIQRTSVHAARPPIGPCRALVVSDRQQSPFAGDWRRTHRRFQTNVMERVFPTPRADYQRDWRICFTNNKYWGATTAEARTSSREINHRKIQIRDMLGGDPVMSGRNNALSWRSLKCGNQAKQKQ